MTRENGKVKTPVKLGSSVSVSALLLQDSTSSTPQVQAVYSFHAEEADELEFKAGDIIMVLDRSSQSWWKGQLRGKTGLFPCNFTAPI